MRPAARFFLVLSILLCAALQASEVPWECDKVPGRVVLKVHPAFKLSIPIGGSHRSGMPSLDRILDDLDAWKIERKHPHCLSPKPGGTDLTRTYNLYFSNSIPVDSVCRELRRLDCIEYAEPWLVFRYFFNHNDPRRNEQWGLDLCQANDAHDFAIGNQDAVIAIVDMGTELDHPDLAANIWINPGEDLNGDGVIQNDERNGQDDDGNGFRDDFFGWDFENRDNNPDDPYHAEQGGGHGTHTAGIAAAVTNNRVGIASVGFRCRIMPVRCGDIQGIHFGIEGIEYAANMGAEVISCSWGGYQRIAALEDVVNYAYEHGSLIVAAAGNENLSSRSYPASYDHVIAVAATDREDIKWNAGGRNGSNFGEWVDISAPGVGILSAMPDGEYEAHDGTSMACPFAGSVALLLRAAFPALSVDEITGLLMDGADNIDDLNPNYRGRLGAGRINAYRSLMLCPLIEIDIGELEVTTDDDENGEMDPGETIELVVDVSLGEDVGESLHDVAISLTCYDESVIVDSGLVNVELLEPGARFSNDEEPFVLQIDADAIPHTTWLTVSVDSDSSNIHRSRTFERLIGVPAVLIVDDDGGDDIETRYIGMIEQMEAGWARWDITQHDSLPSVEDLSRHDMVLWATGSSLPPLDDAERRALISSIGRGSNVLLIGKYIGDDAANRVLLRDYFGAAHDRDSVNATTVRGLGGYSPLHPGVNLILYDDNAERDARISPSTMNAANGGVNLAVYRLGYESNGVAGVFRIDPRSGARTIYLGFALEDAVDDLTPRYQFLSLLYDWCSGSTDAPVDDPNEVAGFNLLPAYPNPFNNGVMLHFQLPVRADYTLSVSDLQGRVIELISRGTASIGMQHVWWDGADRVSGVYILRLEADGFQPLYRKVVLIK